MVRFKPKPISHKYFVAGSLTGNVGHIILFFYSQFLYLHAKIFAGTDFEGNVVNSSKMLNTNVDMQVDFR